MTGLKLCLKHAIWLCELAVSKTKVKTFVQSIKMFKAFLHFSLLVGDSLEL